MHRVKTLTIGQPMVLIDRAGELQAVAEEQHGAGEDGNNRERDGEVREAAHLAEQLLCIAHLVQLFHVRGNDLFSRLAFHVSHGSILLLKRIPRKYRFVPCSRMFLASARVRRQAWRMRGPARRNRFMPMPAPPGRRMACRTGAEAAPVAPGAGTRRTRRRPGGGPGGRREGGREQRNGMDPAHQVQPTLEWEGASSEQCHLTRRSASGCPLLRRRRSLLWG